MVHICLQHCIIMSFIAGSIAVISQVIPSAVMVQFILHIIIGIIMPPIGMPFIIGIIPPIGVIVLGIMVFGIIVLGIVIGFMVVLRFLSFLIPPKNVNSVATGEQNQSP